MEKENKLEPLNYAAEAKKQQPIALTPDDLREIVSGAVRAAVQESKKPTEIEQRKLDQELRNIEAAQQDRRESSQQQIEIMEKKKVQKKLCAHEGGRPVHPHTVFVVDDIGGYVLCQVCQAVVRSGEAPKDYKGDQIYSTDLFNRLFQKTSASGLFA